MPVLLDNKGQGKVGDALGKSIQADAHLSIVSSLFSIYGYAVLKKKLAHIDALRLLIPSNDAGATLPGDKQPLQVTGLVGDEGDRRFRNSLNLTEIARECAGWLEQKADIRAVSLPVFQNLFHIENTDSSTVAIHGSSPFTSSGLGFTPSRGYDMNTYFTTPTETAGLLNWFDSIWTNPDATRDIKTFILAQLEEIYATKSPELVYS